MKATLLYAIFILMTVPAISQNRISFDASKEPYMLIDTFKFDLKFLVISRDKIETLDILQDSNAVKMYGDKATHGAVIIKTKPKTKLLRVNDILDKYNITKADKKLRICINKTLVNQPELILIEADEILGIEITTDWNFINVEDAKRTERFINIKIPLREVYGF